jgi:beta-galactosidase
MIRKSFNEKWTVEKDTGRRGFPGMMQPEEPPVYITLPHDAMILETRDRNTANKGNTGYYPGGIYTYTKKFEVPADWAEKVVVFEFEGVYMNAMVYINGDYAGKQPYGYSNFYIDAAKFLKPGGENELKVVAKNSAMPNSRWYTGSGIYRNVKIMVGDSLHIAVDGVKITTPDADEELATVRVNTTLESISNKTRSVRVETFITDSDGIKVAYDIIPLTAFPNESIKVEQRMEVYDPKLWSCETPYLYTCTTRIIEDGIVIDEDINPFGIRTLRLDVKHGLRINGKTVKLRGACVHSDNGIIGACALERAEERRVQIMKDAGFNAIRSAHNPISKEMLDACDRLGMLVMDELTDIWNVSKNSYDYSLYFDEWWEKDAEAMVKKDFNHPSVIIYSTGNEIAEFGTPAGNALNRKIANKFKALDSTRFTSNGLNGLFFGMRARRRPAAGANVAALNNAIAANEDRFQDGVAVMEIVDQKSEEAYAGVDIAGYNYMAARYSLDKDLYPNRVILGSEDDPDDIARLWRLVTANPHVIGDMTWTGYDYLGEAGCGVYHYDGRSGFGADNWPDRAAYIGDIDLIGNRRCMSYYREIAYGLRTAPYIAVRRLNRYGMKFSKTKWMGEDNIASWTWPGYEGKPGIVDIFSNSDEAELILNGKSLGRKQVDERLTATFELTYEPGEIVAVSYKGGKETGRMSLKTASENVSIKAVADRDVIKADGADLSYVMVTLVDENGSENLFTQKAIECKVEGAGTLQGYGSADPSGMIGYNETVWDTYDGHVLAVVRAGFEEGEIKVTFSAEGCEDVTVSVKVKR